MTDISSLISTFACSLFAGAAIYINLVEHPARMSCGTEIAATEFVPSYRRATVMQVALAVLATLFAVVSWSQNGQQLWLWGAALIFAVIPFTAIAILPTNTRLLDPGRDRTSDETAALLRRWGRLHAVRSILSVIATSILLRALMLGSGY